MQSAPLLKGQGYSIGKIGVKYVLLGFCQKISHSPGYRLSVSTRCELLRTITRFLLILSSCFLPRWLPEF